MTTDATAGRTLLYVHGRDFKPDAETLLDLSMAALRSGIERDYPGEMDGFDAADKRLAYYGDIGNELLVALGRHYDAALDAGDRRNALAALRGIPARKKFSLRAYDSLPGKTALPELLTDLLAPLLGVTGLTMPVLRRIAPDFAAYLDDSNGFGARVRERVRDALCAAFDSGHRVMLVAHGTGCAAAYDALWSLSHDAALNERYGEYKVDLWLTLGAPLGDRAIRRRLAGAGGRSISAFPTNVIAWHNVSAEDDYTCHDNTLADDFRRMMKERVVSGVRDYHIYNLAVRYGRSNPHSSLGYLVHPRVSKIARDWLQSDAAEQSPKYIF